MDWQSLATLVGAIFSSQALTIYIQGKFSQGKTNADAASVLMQSALEWQKTLTDRISLLENKIAERDGQIEARDKRIDELQGRVAHLEAELLKTQTKRTKTKITL